MRVRVSLVHVLSKRFLEFFIFNFTHSCLDLLGVWSLFGSTFSIIRVTLLLPSISKAGEKCCVSEELRYLTKWWLTNEFTHMSPLCRRIKLTDWAFGDTMVLDEEVKDRVSYPYWKSRISFCPWISKPEMKARTFSRAYLVKKCKTFREKSCLVLLQSKYSLASFKGKHDER